MSEERLAPTVERFIQLGFEDLKPLSAEAERLENWLIEKSRTGFRPTVTYDHQCLTVAFARFWTGNAAETPGLEALRAKLRSQGWDEVLYEDSALTLRWFRDVATIVAGGKEYRMPLSGSVPSQVRNWVSEGAWVFEGADAVFIPSHSIAAIRIPAHLQPTYQF